MKFPSFSIRGKLTMAALGPLVFILLLVAIAVFYMIGAWIVDDTQKKVRNDLVAAREIFHHEEDTLRDLVDFTAGSSEFVEALASGDGQSLARQMREIRLREGIDLLSLVDNRGRSLALGAEQGAGGPPPSFVLGALEGGDFSGMALLSEDEMLHESAELAEKARIEPPDSSSAPETRGLFIVNAAVVRDRSGRVIGCLYGGILLNNNLRLIDSIQSIVYGSETFLGTHVGSATIFLDNLRAATTIRLKDGRRALGTRVSPEVAERVLELQETWLARAKVVDEWYLTAYEPIVDSSGKAIGALYVGLLEKPFDALKVNAALVLLALLLLGCVLGYAIARPISGRLSRPIRELDATARRVAAGERGLRLEVSTEDEIGGLTGTFNRMTAALSEREGQLSGLNKELEAKVAERTELLEKKSLELIRTQEELLRSEKLAAIGSLAAGVAHEINNPAAIIRGNVEILMMNLSEEDPSREEAEEILRNTERIAHITRNMLTFAGQRAARAEEVPLGPLIEEILAQAGHQVSLDGIDLDWQLDPDLPPVAGDRQRLRQVFTNILINAVQAMEGEGELGVSGRLAGEAVEIRVSDTGPGIDADTREKIFNPFFTTKSGGTGLGLSVSYGIVQALGGTIEVESSGGEGTCFLIRLPLAGR